MVDPLENHQRKHSTIRPISPSLHIIVITFCIRAYPEDIAWGGGGGWRVNSDFQTNSYSFQKDPTYNDFEFSKFR